MALRYGLQIVTPATETAVALDELRTPLRLDSNDFDSELTGLLWEAQAYIERHTSRALLTQTWDLTLDRLPSTIVVPRAPLASVTSIKYLDDNGAEQTLSSTLYRVDTASDPGRIVKAYGQSYPSVQNTVASVTVRFVAGYGDPDDVPEDLKRAMKLYCQWMHYNDTDIEPALQSLVEARKIDWLEFHEA